MVLSSEFIDDSIEYFYSFLTSFRFVLVVVDKGYDFHTRNVNHDRMRVLKEYCKSVGAQFMSPDCSGGSKDKKFIFQYDGKVVPESESSSCDSYPLCSMFL